MTRRVAVTGIGVISALGRTRDDFWRALAAGASGIRPMTLVPPGSVRFPNAAEVPDFRAEDHMDPKHADLLDRFAQFALIAAREAVADSGIEFDAALREASAIVTGSCLGGKSTEDDGFRGLRAESYALPAAVGSQGDGQRGRQPHLARIRHHRPGLHHFDRMFLRQSRHRPGVLDGPQRIGGNRHRRR
jgi:3-oxoacyl-(acyl-carrier-protein) synthase